MSARLVVLASGAGSTLQAVLDVVAKVAPSDSAVSTSIPAKSFAVISSGVIILAIFMALQELGIATDIVTTAFASQRAGMAVLVVFFGVGALVLSRVEIANPARGLL